jgi:hypothetical protein
MFYVCVILLVPFLVFSNREDDLRQQVFSWIPDPLHLVDDCPVYQDEDFSIVFRKFLYLNSTFTDTVYEPILKFFENSGMLPHDIFTSYFVETRFGAPFVSQCAVLTLFAYEAFFAFLMRDLILFYEHSSISGGSGVEMENNSVKIEQ